MTTRVGALRRVAVAAVAAADLRNHFRVATFRLAAASRIKAIFQYWRTSSEQLV